MLQANHSIGVAFPISEPSTKATMGNWKQFVALLYKDLYIRCIKRHYIASTVQILCPFLLCGLVLYLRVEMPDQSALPRWTGPIVYPPVGPYTKENITIVQKHSVILFTPNNTYTRKMMEVFKNPETTPFPEIRGFNCETDLMKEVEHIKGRFFLAVLFGNSTENSILDYALRFNSTYNFQTRRRFSGRFPRETWPTNEEKGQLFPIMYSFFDAHVKHHKLNISSMPGIHRHPTPRYLVDEAFSKLSYFLPQFFSFGILLFAGYFTKQIIVDKASRIRELLRMMGLSDVVYWAVLFLIGMIFLWTISLLGTFIYCTPFGGIAVLSHSHPTLIFGTFLVFSVATILHLLLIATIFNGPTIGAVVAVLSWIIGLLVGPNLMDTLDSDGEENYIFLSLYGKLASSVLPPCGLYWAFKVIGFWEGSGKGAQWWNIHKIATPGDNISLLGVLSMMCISSLVHAMFIFYLDAVIPWQYGVPKSPFFLFQKSYWLSSSVKEKSPSNGVGESVEMFEKSSRSAGEPVVVLSHVTKDFGQKRALNNLSLSLYKNQITVLLGHNGAGKTTAMSILTGLFPPTSGDMYINGFSVRTDTKKARESVGLCPQHNVLFDELTVDEHLRFFSSIKGQSYADTELEIGSLLLKFDLLHKRYVLSKDLSGGMKRKLSMANALIGGSKIVILDEPTAGMDPQARRGVWSILQEARKERTIMLSTHYMEEADVLGDRIAFLAGGTLKCSGSPMFLKKKYETGYKMRVAKADPSTDVENIVDVIHKFLGQSGCYLETNLRYEFCVNLGFPSAEDLIPLFRHIEEHGKELGISSLGVSVTTMEDVFMKVGQLDGEDGRDDLSEDSYCSYSGEETFPRFQRDIGPSLLMLQFNALFMKRVNSMKRQWWMPLFLFVLPAALCALFCYLDASQLMPKPSEPDITYTMQSIFGNTQGFINGNNSKTIEYSMKSDGISVDPGPIPNITEYLLEKAAADIINYKQHLMMGVDTEDLTLWCNGEPFHTGATALVHLQAALLSQATKTNATVVVANRPIGTNQENMFYHTIGLPNRSRIMAVIPISISFAFLTCSLVLFPISENISKAKLLQLMSGVNRVVFFGASYVFDYILLFMAAVAMLIVFLIYNPVESFTTFSDTWISILVIIMLYGYVMIPFSYMVSYIFKKPATGFTTMLIFTSLSGSVLALIILMIDFLAVAKNNPFNISINVLNTWIHILTYLPNFGAVWGFMNAHTNGLSKYHCSQFTPLQRTVICLSDYKSLASACCHPCASADEGLYCFQHTSPFHFDIRNGIGFQMVALLVTGTAMNIMLILAESNPQKFVYVLSEALSWSNIKKRLMPQKKKTILTRAFSMIGEDGDVIAEKESTNLLVESVSGGTGDQALVVHHLTKYFGGLKAVDDISFRVHNEECFGLLGVNGAGKTTTFGMLTGDLLLSSGNAYIRNSELKCNLRKFQEHIGYCPQFDALIDTMTGREMLKLYCALRGVPRARIRETVDFMISVVDLRAHADKTTQSYSGGNKRKLSIALALIGNPQVLFLDEPTAGIDPGARRKIWKTLMMAQKSLGSAIVLTSHSMEECEALCNRLCIMVNGHFKCIGSTQHLKSKFGQGFTVLMKLKEDNVGEAHICNVMDDTFPGGNTLKENHMNTLHFHITDTNIRWSEMFEKMEYLKKSFDLEDVVVSDTTLEQIFLTFAKSQRISEEDGGSSIPSGTVNVAFEGDLDLDTNFTTIQL